jgi:hypothetical protein
LLKIADNTPTDLVTVSDVVRYIDGLLALQAPVGTAAQTSVRASM